MLPKQRKLWRMKRGYKFSDFYLKMMLRLPYLLLAIAVLCFSVTAVAGGISCSDIRFTAEATAIYDHIDKACVDFTEWQGNDYVRLEAMVVAQTRSGTHLRFSHGNRQRGEPYRAAFPDDFQVLLNGQVVELGRLGIRQDVDILVPGSYWEIPVPEPEANEDAERADAQKNDPDLP